LWLWQCAEYGPDEAAEFSGDGDMTMFALINPEELIDEAELSLLGNGDDLGWLPLTTAFEDKGRSVVVTVVPCGFDQQASDVDVAGFGDGATLLLSRLP
jgi:hypothetical protein